MLAKKNSVRENVSFSPLFDSAITRMTQKIQFFMVNLWLNKKKLTCELQYPPWSTSVPHHRAPATVVVAVLKANVLCLNIFLPKLQNLGSSLSSENP